MNKLIQELNENLYCPLFVPHYFSDNNFSKIQQNKKPLKSAFLIIIITKICRKSL